MSHYRAPYRPKPKTCGLVRDDGTRCGSFANSSGLCPTHAGSPGVRLGRGWDRDHPYREGWTPKSRRSA